MEEPEPNLHPYQVSLSIGQKISCSLSIIGSLMIISQVCRNKVNRSKCQQRLILGISIIDFNTSVYWLFTSLFVPPLDMDLLVLNASGSQATCNAQVFTNQFNVTGVLYMLSLQVQYMLVIMHGWKEKKIRKVEPYMHVLQICIR